MRGLEGRSRYNLWYIRFLSHYHRRGGSSPEPLDAIGSGEGVSGARVAAASPVEPGASATPGDSSLFSGRFADLGASLSDRVVRSLRSCGFERTTVIQSLAIPKILGGCDVLIRSATGSGKTLTFLVPALHRLVSPDRGSKLTRQDGTILMIICPTRELSVQTKDTAARLSRPFPWIVVAAIKGGDSRKSEKAQLRKGITVLVGTPGRVLDHCEKTASFNASNIEMFVLDEADRLLDMGFEVKIRGIYKFLSASRAPGATGRMQTVMTSATLTDAVHNLADFCLRTNRVTLGIEDDDLLSLPSTLTHEYVLVDCKDKFICLVSLLLKYVDAGEKVIIFVANCQSVVFLHRLLQTLTWPTIGGSRRDRAPVAGSARSSAKAERYSSAIEDYELSTGAGAGSFKGAAGSTERPAGPPVFAKVPILMLHGSMEPNDRMGYMNDFMGSKSAILVSTDVSSRGLNLSQVSRVIQYDPPQQLEEYIHRSGRTARLGGSGSGMVVLMQHEVHFIEALRKRGVCVRQVPEGRVWSYIEQTFVPKHLRTFKGYNVQFLRNCFSDLVACDAELLLAGQSAFRASVQSYKTYSRDLRRIFDFRKLHLGHYAASFCLKQRPSDILHDSHPSKSVVENSGKKRFDRAKPVVKPSAKRPKPQKPRSQPRAPKAASLSTSASQAALKALELLKARNQVLTR